MKRAADAMERLLYIVVRLMVCVGAPERTKLRTNFCTISEFSDYSGAYSVGGRRATTIDGGK